MVVWNLFGVENLLGNLVVRIDGNHLLSVLLGSVLVVLLDEVVRDEVVVRLLQTSLVGVVKVGLGTDEFRPFDWSGSI